MPDESKQIHVIGIDTSSVESFFEAKKKPIFKSERIAGPQRILNSFKIWLKDKNIKDHKFEFIETDKLNNFINTLNVVNLHALCHGILLYFGLIF